MIRFLFMTCVISGEIVGVDVETVGVDVGEEKNKGGNSCSTFGVTGVGVTFGVTTFVLSSPET